MVFVLITEVSYGHTVHIILVTGATGQQGGAVARALLTKGQKVRVMTRTPAKASALAKAGAEVVKGNLTDALDLQAALHAKEIRDCFAKVR